jgi:hypothetical protein
MTQFNTYGHHHSNHLAHLFATLLTAAAIAGCGSDPGDSERESTAPLHQECDGEYRCEGPEDTFESTLERRGEQCLMGGEIVLTDAGELLRAADGEQITGVAWSGDSKKFELCGAAACIECTATAERGSAGGSSKPAAGKCVGTPRSCSSLGAGTCVLDGCSFSSRVTWDGEFEYECDGQAQACSSYKSEGLCEQQTGCSWE